MTTKIEEAGSDGKGLKGCSDAGCRHAGSAETVGGGDIQPLDSPAALNLTTPLPIGRCCVADGDLHALWCHSESRFSPAAMRLPPSLCFADALSSLQGPLPCPTSRYPGYGAPAVGPFPLTTSPPPSTVVQGKPSLGGGTRVLPVSASCS